MKVVSVVVVVACVVAAVGAQSFGPQQQCGDSVPTTQTYGCQYFVRSYTGQYVCDRNQKPAFKCPILRPTCTRFFGPPAECVTDNDCSGSDKCCCDACLPHPVCKPSQ